MACVEVHLGQGERADSFESAVSDAVGLMLPKQ